jgi:nucleotide-binding universal stress UspA family protein
MQTDLVVVGHRARTGLARWWTGPENTQLLDRVRCSILVAVSSAGEANEVELSTAAAAERV